MSVILADGSIFGVAPSGRLYLSGDRDLGNAIAVMADAPRAHLPSDRLWENWVAALGGGAFDDRLLGDEMLADADLCAALASARARHSERITLREEADVRHYWQYRAIGDRFQHRMMEINDQYTRAKAVVQWRHPKGEHVTNPLISLRAFDTGYAGLANPPRTIVVDNRSPAGSQPRPFERLHIMIPRMAGFRAHHHRPTLVFDKRLVVDATSANRLCVLVQTLDEATNTVEYRTRWVHSAHLDSAGRRGLVWEPDDV